MKWTKEKCEEFALKCDSKTNFRIKHAGAYEIARKNKWLDEFFLCKAKIRKWTYNKCVEEALKYKTKTEFKKLSGGAYNASRKNMWLDEICKHMIEIHLTEEKCRNEALKFDNKKDFFKNSSKIYAIAYKNNWLDEICSHMKKLGNKMLRCIYVYEFSDKSAYIGLTYNLEKRNISRKLQKNDAVTKFILETNLQPNLKQLSEYISVDIAAILENDCIEFYKVNGWNVLNKVKGGAIGSTNKFWTKEKCEIEALKYNSRSEFYYKSNNIYSAACRNGWLNDVCKHMTYKIIHWTKEKCEIEALKYNSRSEFIKNNKAAYTWAIRNNVLEDICLHMKNHKI